MPGPIPAGLTLIIEIVLDSPTTRAPKPGKHSSDPAEHGRLPLLCPASHIRTLRYWQIAVTLLSSLTLTNQARRGGATMQAVVRWLIKHVVLLSLLTAPAAGCSAERDDSTADATTSSSITTAGPGPFVAEARAMTFGTKDLAAASDGELLRLGNVVCDGLGIEGLGFRQVLQRLVQSQAHPTTTEATAFVRNAVRNLCPQHASAIG
jgi:hypothetical protein